MSVPSNLHYTKDHEWLLPEDANRTRVGITDFAQKALGDIVFVELPAVGSDVAAGDVIAEVESTKSVSEVYSPVSGKVVEVNEGLTAAPESINTDPYDKGWICVIESDVATDPAEFLSPTDYSSITQN